MGGVGRREADSKSKGSLRDVGESLYFSIMARGRSDDNDDRVIQGTEMLISSSAVTRYPGM